MMHSALSLLNSTPTFRVQKVFVDPYHDRYSNSK